MTGAWYNENDPHAAQWLRNLIGAGLLPQGHVDERSIEDVSGSDLAGFRQCHFFAGVGGWPHALDLAGWGDRPVWTGSCPCQPLSSAGQRKGHADRRHLWPAFHRLIAECAPAMVFGEQVASADGREWLAAVRADLERDGYAVGAADLCAAGIGAPHIRQRLWWLACRLDIAAGGRREWLGHQPAHGEPLPGGQEVCRLADAERADGCGQYRDGMGGASRAGEGSLEQRQRLWPDPADGGADGGMADAGGRQFPVEIGEPQGRDGAGPDGADPVGSAWRAGPVNGHWRAADWLFCWDGKWRPVEPGTFPLAHGIPGRVGRLRAYGNAIVPQVAATFIRAAMEAAA